MKQFLHTAGAILVSGAILIMGFGVSLQDKASGGVVSQRGSNLTVATSSLVSVGGDLATTIFEANSDCATRHITVWEDDIWVSTDPDITPSVHEGIPHTATSTTLYDNDSVTCDAWTARSSNSTSTIFITEYEL